MDRRNDEDDIDGSPLATVRRILPSPHLLSVGPIRYLLVAGEQDGGGWGMVGAFWRTIDGRHGGFLVCPEAVWAGSEMVKSFRGALGRGWTVEQIYAYWHAHVGVTGQVLIDPQQHADSLFQVARRVGAI
ncbi:MAG TPA: hypothetical protein VFQ40_04890 [Actinomycetota bacterium]|nr:hypothetical protein [Actinomycetota bacterium]